MNSDMINKSAVSPVLAVTFLIAVTVGVSGIVGMFVLDVGDLRSNAK
jgi:FlaG/FlaF family flagellin (archaellin)